MKRRDPEYWRRLSKDRRSTIAGLLTALAAVTSTTSLSMALVEGSQYAARGNPLYWLILLPMAWWINGLASYAPGFVRSWKPVLALFCAISVGCLMLAISRDRDVTLTAVMCGITLVAAILSMVAYRNSVVAREGPAR